MMAVNQDVLESVSHFFSAELGNQIREWGPYNIHDLGIALQEAVRETLGYSNPCFSSWPATVDEFFSSIAPAFSPRYMAWRQNSLAEFSRVIEGEGDLTNGFIQEQSTDDWVHALTAEIASYGLRTVKRQF